MGKYYANDGSLIGIDYQEDVDSDHNIEQTHLFIKAKVKLSDNKEIICLADRHSYLRDDSIGSVDDCEIKSWRIYNPKLTCPNITFKNFFEGFLSRENVVEVIEKYESKEDAEKDFKKMLLAYYKRRVGINDRFTMQAFNKVNDVKIHKAKDPIEKYLFDYLTLKDLLNLRAICRRTARNQLSELKKTTIHYLYDKEKDLQLYAQAVSLYKAQKYETALDYFLKLLAVKRRDMVGLLGSEETASLEYNIGSIYLVQNEPEKALTYLRSAYNTRSFIFGDDNDKTKKVKAKLSAKTI